MICRQADLAVTVNLADGAGHTACVTVPTTVKYNYSAQAEQLAIDIAYMYVLGMGLQYEMTTFDVAWDEVITVSTYWSLGHIHVTGVLTAEVWEDVVRHGT